MTGTGTQADPYIVDNWADFMSTSKNATYIEWDKNAENKVIDFNEIRPQGYSTTVKMGGHTKYNGWVFKNFYSTASIALEFGSAGETISGVTFENLYWEVSGSASYFLHCEGNYSNKSVFDNCIFSGRIAIPSAGCFCSEIMRRCALNLSISSLSDTFRLSYENIENSDIILDIPNVNTFIVAYRNVTNSRISGKISATTSVKICESSTSGYNIINFESNQPLKYVGFGISVYNSDLAEKDSSSTNLIGCTPEQLKNAEYLYSIGFPIGVE
ncbi:MAG: hypothetical protein K2K02_11215 [Ruminococcus sp.]|nr:hypothetical protein [Ruminococcus sp.]